MVAINDVVDDEFVATTGETIRVPDPNRLTHMQFRRFAGCPICNVHLQSVVRRHAEIDAAGIREVVFFHSSAEDVAAHTAGLPFPTVADPDKRYYRQFGVESGRRALLHPGALAAAARGAAMTASGRFRAPAMHQDGGHLGLPADFLVDARGRVVAAKHGTHAYDQWSVDELLALPRTGGRTD